MQGYLRDDEAKVNVLDLLAGSVTWICQHPGTVTRGGSALRDKIKWVTGLVSEISAFPGHPYIRQLRTPIVLGVSHTSRIGTCSSHLLSHCTEMFDAERKKWDTTISNKPAFLSRNADAFQCHTFRDK